jgi:hypothetical protein
MNLLDAIKKKGFKINVLKIPTRKTPQQIEHKIHNEFDRARTISVLKAVEVFLTDPNKTEDKASGILVLVSSFRRELEAYKS